MAPQKGLPDQFPNVIAYAATKQIMAMYGNPHTPLLPHFPNNIWSSTGSNKCLGCNNIVGSEKPPQSPKRTFDYKGSYNNLTENHDRNNSSLRKHHLGANASHASKPNAMKHVAFANSLIPNSDLQQSPTLLSSPGNLLSH